MSDAAVADVKFDRSLLRMGFDALLAIIVAAVGFMVNALHGELQEIKRLDKLHSESLANIREKLPLEYVRMDLYIRDRQEMMNLLHKIDTNVREHREAMGALTSGYKKQ